ncbi:TonB-dependent receptor [hydrothermal vent metagenome]|uniref:TonB-dependent receptor n=1 Tax=hydrothermal vent metagenome TaxID=652676 RepID=A0A1W1EKU2_9ZZZZ
MNKKIYLSMLCVVALNAESDLGTIEVSEKVNVKVVENVNGEEVKSADLAEALSKNIPSISLIRRSGIANDVTLRGQKRDNIKVTVDGAVIYGACVNRMDPPTSHVVTNAIDDVEVSEGPFDVEEFGTLSGSIKIKTKKPNKKFSGEFGINVGSYGYQKFSTTLSGGSDFIKVLFTASKEKGEQYEDGDGNSLSTQLSNYTASTVVPTDNPFNYSNANKNMDAFEKDMYMGKIFIDISENQELKLSYTANRSKNVLYPSSKMDAILDDSDIINLEYSAKNLGRYSKELNLHIYNSQVEHPMSTQYRQIALTKGAFKTHYLTTDMSGLRLKNSFDLWGSNITYGIDASKRNWNGKYTSTNLTTNIVKTIGKSIDDVDTENRAFFMKYEKSFGKIDVEIGARYDDTTIKTASLSEKDRDFNSLSGSIFATYNVDRDTKYFIGFGKSSRVPDARELYNVKYNTTKMPPIRVLNGNPNLEQTTNYELDLGFEKKFEKSKIKFKAFYSKLDDYIYYNGSLKTNNFENIDATIYGAELSASYMPNDDLYFDIGISYKKGEKDTLTTGQSDKDLADITPLKLNASVTYDYDENGDMELSFVAGSRWDSVDEENGEQVLAGYGVVNFKTTREFDNGVKLTIGVDNLLDKTYTTTNTYKDLILMTDGSDTMLINEPGRYVYANLNYSF